MDVNEKKEERFLSEQEVKKASGDLSRATRWRMSRDGTFPKPVRISKNRVAWLQSEISKWIEERVSKREVEQ